MENNFENLMERYKEISNLLEDDNLTIEENIDLYKESQEIYFMLQEIIENHKITINSIREKNVWTVLFRKRTIW